MQILVVEDERKMAELLERALSEEGHQVVLAGDGFQGFDRIVQMIVHQNIVVFIVILNLTPGLFEAPLDLFFGILTTRTQPLF